MNRIPPAHKQTCPDKAPGQIVNPVPHQMMDDMGEFAQRKLYRPTHGGYPTPAPYSTDLTAEERQALKLVSGG